MQDFLDESELQIKKIANFNIDAERELNRLSVYDFLFHLECYHENQPE